MTAEELLKQAKIHENGDGVPKDEDQAARYYYQAALQGNAEGCEKTASCYENGRGVPKDEAQAIKWYQAAIGAGSKTSYELIADLYFFSEDPNVQDYRKALDHYLKAAEFFPDRGYVFYSLGYTYRELKDEEAACKAFLRSAEIGYSYGLYEAGRCFEFGWGTSKDMIKAVEYYRKGAQKGEKYSCERLGRCLSSGSGAEQDEAEAEFWLEKALSKGVGTAAFPLGKLRLYAKDRKVLNIEKAVENLNRSISDGYSVALSCYHLGMLYKNGYGGTPLDYEKAVGFFRRAHELGNASATNQLAICYAEGQGTEKDEAECFRLLSSVEKKNNLSAMTNLARCYFRGIGTQKDEKRAEALLRRCIEKGSKMSESILAELLCESSDPGIRDVDQAMELFYKIASSKSHRKTDKGNANYQIGKILLSGRDGVAANERLAVTYLYTSAYEYKNKAALALLAECTLNGRGRSAPDPVSAYFMYIEAGKYKKADSVFESMENNQRCKVAARYMRRGEYDKACSLLERAAKDDASVSFLLGAIYDEGYGVDADREKARLYYSKAYELGMSRAEDGILNLKDERQTDAVLRCPCCSAPYEIRSDTYYCPGCRLSQPKAPFMQTGIIEKCNLANLRRCSGDFEEAAKLTSQLISQAPRTAAVYLYDVLARFEIRFLDSPMLMRVNTSVYRNIYEDEGVKRAIALAAGEEKKTYLNLFKAIHKRMTAMVKDTARFSSEVKAISGVLCYSRKDIPAAESARTWNKRGKYLDPCSGKNPYICFPEEALLQAAFDSGACLIIFASDKKYLNDIVCAPQTKRIMSYYQNRNDNGIIKIAVGSAYRSVFSDSGIPGISGEDIKDPEAYVADYSRLKMDRYFNNAYPLTITSEKLTESVLKIRKALGMPELPASRSVDIEALAVYGTISENEETLYENVPAVIDTSRHKIINFTVKTKQKYKSCIIAVEWNLYDMNGENKLSYVSDVELDNSIDYDLFSRYYFLESESGMLLDEGMYYLTCTIPGGEIGTVCFSVVNGNRLRSERTADLFGIPYLYAPSCSDPERNTAARIRLAHARFKELFAAANMFSGVIDSAFVEDKAKFVIDERYHYCAVLLSNGRVKMFSTDGKLPKKYFEPESWSNIIKVFCCLSGIVGLTSNGRVLYAGKNSSCKKTFSSVYNVRDMIRVGDELRILSADGRWESFSLSYEYLVRKPCEVDPHVIRYSCDDNGAEDEAIFINRINGAVSGCACDEAMLGAAVFHPYHSDTEIYLLGCDGLVRRPLFMNTSEIASEERFVALFSLFGYPFGITYEKKLISLPDNAYRREIGDIIRPYLDHIIPEDKKYLFIPE